MISDVNGNPKTTPSEQFSRLASSLNDSGFVDGSVSLDSLYDSPTSPPRAEHQRHPVSRKLWTLSGPFGTPIRTSLASNRAFGEARGHQEHQRHQRGQQFLIQLPTQGRRPDSPD